MARTSKKVAASPYPSGVFAVCYLRFSTKEQRKGDSNRRQSKLANEWSSLRGIPINETIRDPGVSAFRGQNALIGKLSLFLDLIRAGKVPRGTFLLVESLDRLSRDSALNAFRLVSEILLSGITIVSLLEGVEYSEEALKKDPNALFLWLGTAIRANQESVLKSQRIRESWQNKRNKARDEKRVLTSRLPGWLRLAGSGPSQKIELWPERAELVRWIFEKTIAGYGRRRIVQHLNLTKVPPFRGSKEWHSSIVVKILKSRAVLGEFQPYTTDPTGRRLPDGDLIPDYYPPLIPLKDFNQANAAILSRRAAAGRRGPTLPNLLQGLVYCRACGSRMSLQNKGAMPKGGRYFVCSSNDRSASCSNSTRWRLDRIESAVLDRALKVDWSEFEPTEDGSLAVTLNQKRLLLADIVLAAEHVLNEVEKGMTLAKGRLASLQAQSDALTAEIAEIEREMATTQSVPPREEHEAIVQSLRRQLAEADEATASDLRTRISQTLRWSIERIEFSTQQVTVRYQSGSNYQYPNPPLRYFAIAYTPEMAEKLAREAELDDLPEVLETDPKPFSFPSTARRLRPSPANDA